MVHTRECGILMIPFYNWSDIIPRWNIST